MRRAAGPVGESADDRDEPPRRISTSNRSSSNGSQSIVLPPAGAVRRGEALHAGGQAVDLLPARRAVDRRAAGEEAGQHRDPGTRGASGADEAADQLRTVAEEQLAFASPVDRVGAEGIGAHLQLALLVVVSDGGPASVDPIDPSVAGEVELGRERRAAVRLELVGPDERPSGEGGGPVVVTTT